MNNDYLKIIAKCANIEIEPDKIKGEHLLIDDLMFDSINFVSLIVMLEDRYNISFDDEYISMTALKTVQNVVDYIEKRQK